MRNCIPVRKRKLQQKHFVSSTTVERFFFTYLKDCLLLVKQAGCGKLEKGCASSFCCLFIYIFIVAVVVGYVENVETFVCFALQSGIIRAKHAVLMIECYCATGCTTANTQQTKNVENSGFYVENLWKMWKTPESFPHFPHFHDGPKMSFPQSMWKTRFYVETFVCFACKSKNMQSKRHIFADKSKFQSVELGKLVFVENSKIMWKTFSENAEK